MKEIKAIIQPFMLAKVLEALAGVDPLPGLIISQVQGWGERHSVHAGARNSVGGHSFAPKTKLEIVVTDEQAPGIAKLIAAAARTGNPGDGKVFLVEVVDAVKVRTGERGEAAL